MTAKTVTPTTAYISHDPSMTVVCPIHSEERNRRGERVGPVFAHYDRRAQRYVCWHCERTRQDTQMENAPMGRDPQVPA